MARLECPNGCGVPEMMAQAALAHKVMVWCNRCHYTNSLQHHRELVKRLKAARGKVKVLAKARFDMGRGGAGSCLCMGTAHSTCTVETCQPVLIIADPAGKKEAPGAVH